MSHVVVLVSYEDFLKSKLIKSSYFINYISQLRHKHSIVFVCIQFFKALTTDWKSNCTSLFIFNGFSRQQLQYTYHQVPFPIEFEKLWQKYIQITGNQFILLIAAVNQLNFINLIQFVVEHLQTVWVY